MNIDYEELRIYKDRIRIFFIIYFFSERKCSNHNWEGLGSSQSREGITIVVK